MGKISTQPRPAFRNDCYYVGNWARRSWKQSSLVLKLAIYRWQIGRESWLIHHLTFYANEPALGYLNEAVFRQKKRHFVNS
jgi:hypothetical protein